MHLLAGDKERGARVKPGRKTNRAVCILMHTPVMPGFIRASTSSVVVISLCVFTCNGFKLVVSREIY
jgi:hypothetical protein